MKLHGSILHNLQSAAASSRRLSGHAVHKDTLLFWSDLLATAREEKRMQPERDWSQIDALIATIEHDLSERSRG